MRIVRSAADLPRGGEIGLVPTMGAFHEGHRALFVAARAENDLVVVSLFVNPAQFDDPRDLGVYPRDPERDERIAATCASTVSQSPRAIGPVSSKPFSIVRRISGSSASGGAPAASSSEPAARRSVTR